MAHLAAWTDVYRNRTFEDQSFHLGGFDVPGTCDGLAEPLDEAPD